MYLIEDDRLAELEQIVSDEFPPEARELLAALLTERYRNKVLLDEIRRLTNTETELSEHIRFLKASTGLKI